MNFSVAKDELIYARISSELKQKLVIEMNRRGEAEAVIVREALNEYFQRRASGTNYSPGLAAAAQLLEHAGTLTQRAPTPQGHSTRPVRYKARRGSKKKPAA